MVDGSCHSNLGSLLASSDSTSSRSEDGGVTAEVPVEAEAAAADLGAEKLNPPEADGAAAGAEAGAL